MLQRFSEGLNEDPRRVAARTTPNAPMPHEARAIENLEYELCDIQNPMQNEHAEIELDVSDEGASEAAEELGGAPVISRAHDMDLRS